MSGMLLKNTSQLTLDDGSLTVIDGDAYAGESLLERLKPAEERLISYALDLGTLVNVSDDEDRKPTYMVKVHDGVAATYYFTERKKLYTIVNQTDKPRALFVEHPRDSDTVWQLDKETPAPDSKTANYYRFRVALKPNERVVLTVTERKENYDTFQLSQLTREMLDFFIASRYLDDQTKAVLEKLVDLKNRLAKVESQIQEMNQQANGITHDQQRLRENIKILASTSEAKQLISRYVAKANEQEDRLDKIEKDRVVLAQERTRLFAELNSSIRGISFDRKID
jgi:hypothetical protein